MTINKLMEQLPNRTTKQQLLDWLYDVFELWQHQPVGEVFGLRNVIAEQLQKKIEFSPDFSLRSLETITPQNESDRDYVLRVGLATLLEPQPVLVDGMRNFFLMSVRRWRG